MSDEQYTEKVFEMTDEVIGDFIVSDRPFSVEFRHLRRELLVRTNYEESIWNSATLHDYLDDIRYELRKRLDTESSTVELSNEFRKN